MKRASCRLKTCDGDGNKNKKKKPTFCFLRRHSPHDVVVLSAREGLCCTASDMVRGPARKGRWRRRPARSTVIGVGVVCVCGKAWQRSTSSGCRADTYKEHRQGGRRWVCEASVLGPLGTSAPGRGDWGREVLGALRQAVVVPKGNGCEGWVSGQGSGPWRDSGIWTGRRGGKGPIGIWMLACCSR